MAILKPELLNTQKVVPQIVKEIHTEYSDLGEPITKEVDIVKLPDEAKVPNIVSVAFDGIEWTIKTR